MASSSNLPSSVPSSWCSFYLVHQLKAFADIENILACFPGLGPLSLGFSLIFSPFLSLVQTTRTSEEGNSASVLGLRGPLLHGRLKLASLSEAGKPANTCLLKYRKLLLAGQTGGTKGKWLTHYYYHIIKGSIIVVSC